METNTLPVDSPETPDEYLCPITQELMREPVVAADGFTYERAAIELWLGARGARATSPLTGVRLAHHTLMPNTTLRNLIREHVAAQPILVLRRQTEGDLQLALRLFEEEHEALLAKRTAQSSRESEDEAGPSAPPPPLDVELNSLAIREVNEDLEEGETLARLAEERDVDDTLLMVSETSVASGFFASSDPGEIAKKLSGRIQQHHGNRTAIAIDAEAREVVVAFSQRGDAQKDVALRATLQSFYQQAPGYEENTQEIVIPWASLLAEHVRHFRHRYQQQTAQHVMASSSPTTVGTSQGSLVSTASSTGQTATTTSPHREVRELVQHGKTLRRLRRYEEAIAECNRALELEPDNVSALYNRGESLRMLGRYEEAIAECNRALGLEPDNVSLLSERGASLRRLGRYEESLADLNRALELEPDNAFALSQRGATLDPLGRYEESLADLNRALELEPDNVSTLSFRGWTLRRLRRYEESLADLNRALELEPDNAQVLSRRGWTLRLLGRYEESLAGLNRALELEPEYARALRLRDETLRAIEQRDGTSNNNQRQLSL